MAAFDAETILRSVRLAVGDVDRQREFYEKVIGLRVLTAEPELVTLGAGGRPIVELEPSAGAGPSPSGATGLFHLAVLVPDRPELARAASRIGRSGWPLTGVADHLVSEALYLDDPEGNGIEIYRDRPRSEWSFEEGSVRMATLPLDLAGLVAAAGGEEPDGLPEGSCLGHVHLKVDDLEAAERFYVGALGLDVMTRGYRGALFVSVGGYHHHLGLNTWTSAGAGPPPPRSLGLRRVDLRAGSADGLALLHRRLEDLRTPADLKEGRLSVRDPAGNPIAVAADGSTADAPYTR